MRFILDTDICVFLIRKKRPELLERIQEHGIGDICISSITVAELQYGVHKSQSPVRNGRALEEFLSPFMLLPFHPYVATTYGYIRACLAKAGKPIGPMDMLIAAHALHHELTLVTNNSREFIRVPRLSMANWLKT